MQTATVVKVISAFMVGLILVMGSALIYSRTRELMYPIQVAQTVPDAQQPSSEAQQPSSVEPQTPEIKQPEVSQQEVSPSSQEPPAPSRESGPVAEPAKPSIHQDHSASYSERSEPRVPRGSQLSLPVSPATETVQNTAPAVVPSAVPPVSSPSTAANQATQPVPTQVAPPSIPAAQPQPQYPAMRQTAAEPNAQPAPAVRHPQVVTLAPGTNLTIRLAETLSTERNLTGDIFRGVLETPIVVNGFIIADRGASVLGRVVSLQKAPLISGTSDLTLQLTQINTTDGQHVRIDTLFWEKKGAKLRIQNTPKMAFGAAVGAVVGALSGAAKGAGISDGFGEDNGTGNVMGKHQRTVVLPIDARITFTLARPVTLTERLNSR